MRRRKRNILLSIFIATIVILLLPTALYLPYIQKIATNYAQSWVAGNTPFRISLEKFSLKFPLRLTLHNAIISTHQNDTVVAAGELQADVALAPLLSGNIVVRGISLHNASINYITPDSSIQIHANAGELGIDNGNIQLSKNDISVEKVWLDNTYITLLYEPTTDTTAQDSKRIKWNFDITDIQISDVNCIMQMPGTFDTLNIALPQAQITAGRVSLEHQTADIATVNITGGNYKYVARNSTIHATTETTPNDTTTTALWQVQLGKIQLTDNCATYITKSHPPKEGLDLSHITANQIDLTVDNIYNRGSELRLHIDDMALRERSGLCITHAQGGFSLNKAGTISISDFQLKTPLSDLQADAEIDMQIFDKNPQASIDLLAKSHLSYRDISTAFPESKQFFIHDYNSQNWSSISDIITVDINISGNGENIDVKQLDMLQPGIFTLTSNAQLNHPLDNTKRDIALSCKLNTTELLSLNNFITDSTLSRRITMQPIHLDTDLHLSGDDVTATALAKLSTGIADLNALYNIKDEKYDVNIDITQLPLSRFLPYDTTDNLSAHIALSGQHFSIDNPTTSIQVQLQIDTLDYRHYRYRDIGITANAGNGIWQLSANSNLQEADLQIKADGAYQKDLLTVNIDADIGMLDLTALHLTQQTLDFSAGITAELVLSDIDSIVQAYIVADSIELGIGDYVYYTNSINLLAASDVTYSYIDLHSGDMSVNLSSDAGLTHLRPALERLTQFVDTIMETQRLDMNELHHGLPPFQFSAHAGTDNILHRYLGSQGIGMSSAHVEASNDSLFNLSALIQRLDISGICLDTITFDAHEKNERLNYRLTLGNRPGNLDDFANVLIEGFLSGNSTRLYCRQNNRKEEVGFLFGCKADFLPNLIQLTFGPKEPIIGYKKWQLNKDNFVTYNYTERDLSADLRLSYDNSHLYITTEDRRNKEVDGAHIDIQQIELSDWFAITPFITPISGLLSANLYIDMPDKRLEAGGNIELKNFTYNTRLVGSIDANVNYLLDTQGGNNIEASLAFEGNNILSGKIYIDNQSSEQITGEISIDKFPLNIANAFMPSNMIELTGLLNSNLTLSGRLEKPDIDGFIRLDNGRTRMNNFGVALTLDNNDITINNSILSFHNFGIRGYNKSPLNIDGIVNLSDLSDIGINLNLRGNNFQPIQSGENRMATLYGSVFTDVDTQIQGTLNALKIDGSVSLLSGTNATYIMQSSGMTSGTDYSDMVSFVSFTDTLSTHSKENLLRRSNSMTAAIDIDIDQGVQLGINLSTDGNNRIDLVGGGNLLYTASALGDNHITGRYILTGGFVRYTPPFISQKIFNIEDGSYVMWNGEISNPMFNITAVQSQRSTVKNGDESRLVDFEVSIIISNTLKNLDISFDLATTDDLAIQNELQGLTEEQRQTKAMNMFLYNSYDNLATAAEDAFINNPLNTFLEYELNTWAQRTLRGVDLTFGIDNYGLDETGTQRTDYSYQFSKSLLDNRLKFVIGGSYASNQDVTQNLKENLIDDISLEYRLTKRENMYLKVFRQTGYESIIEGEITQTGAGFLFRKQVNSLLDLFRKKAKTSENAPVTTDTLPSQASTDNIQESVKSQKNAENQP